VAVRLFVSGAGKWVCFGVILFAEGASGGVASQRMVSPSKGTSRVVSSLAAERAGCARTIHIMWWGC
jgi:hypothetical protein